MTRAPPSPMHAIAMSPAWRRRQSWLTSIGGMYWNAICSTGLPCSASESRSSDCSYACGYVLSVGSFDGCVRD